MPSAKPERAKLRHDFHFRISVDEQAAFHKRASDLGMSPSGFARTIFRQAAGLPIHPGPEIARSFVTIGEDLRRVGININQLARAINEGRFVASDEVSASLVDFANLIYDTRGHMADMLAFPVVPDDSVKK
jgi:hypothetical protein